MKIEEIKITDIKEFAQELLTLYKKETKDISLAACKVRGVI